MDASRRFLGNTDHFFCNLLPALLALLVSLGEALHDDAKFLVLGDVLQEVRILFYFDALMDQERSVTAVIDEQVGTSPVRPGDRLFRTPPVFLQGLTLPGEYGRRTRFGNSRGGMILGRKDIAGGPTEIRSLLASVAFLPSFQIQTFQRDHGRERQ